MLDTTPTPAGLKSKGGQFVFANKAYRQLVNAPKEIEGLFDCDLPCDTALFASTFAQQDGHVVLNNKTVSTIDIHNYAHGYDAFSFNKRPVVINGETWGVQFNAVNLKKLICIEAFAEIMTFDKSHKSFSSVQPREMQLTPSQEIVLFWLLRGRQTKQIALMIHRTPKAVEKQIANLIIRFAIFGVTNRASLIDYARSNGWLSVIPAQLLKQPVSIMIN